MGVQFSGRRRSLYGVRIDHRFSRLKRRVRIGRRRSILCNRGGLLTDLAVRDVRCGGRECHPVVCMHSIDEKGVRFGSRVIRGLQIKGVSGYQDIIRIARRVLAGKRNRLVI